MMLKYNIALDGNGGGVVTIILDGKVETIDHTHPNWTRIMDAILTGDDPAPLLSIEAAITKLDDRVEIRDGVLYFDDQPVHNNLTNTILRYVREGRDTTGLVRFMERLTANPSLRSRQQLFDWTQSVDLTIDEDGYIIGYKGLVRRTDDTDFMDNSGSVPVPLFPLDQYPYKSSSSGLGIVDGYEINGQLPAGEGTVIEMPRSEVQDDPTVGCSLGLHVGNYSYASGFGEVLTEVRFDPADVVSVPTDCLFQKLRCCKYVVVKVHEPEVGDDLSDYEPEATWDEDAAWATLDEVVPQTFMERLRSRFRP